jgi:hypothetical protein
MLDHRADWQGKAVGFDGHQKWYKPVMPLG